MSIGSRPAFSASVLGMTSMASANASMASCSLPPTVDANSFRRSASSTSVAAAARDVLLVLDDDADDAECIMDCPVELVNDVLGAAAQYDGDCLRVLALLDEDHVLVADLALFHEAGDAEVCFWSAHRGWC